MPSLKFFRAAAQDLIAVFHGNHGFQRAGIDTHVEAFLRQPQTGRRGRQHGVDVGLGRGVELVVIDHFGDEAHRERPLGADEAAGENELGRHRYADKARQEVAGADIAAAEAELDEGAVHPRGFRGDADIGGERQCETAAGRGALRSAR